MNAPAKNDELKAAINAAAPLIVNDLCHDADKEYHSGHVVIVEDQHRQPITYIAIGHIPPNENIPVTNTDYWARMEPQRYITNYMVGCAAILFNEDHKVLVGLRRDLDGNLVWALFGGKPEPYETLAEGMSREVGEEVNIYLKSDRYKQLSIKEAMAGFYQRCLTTYFVAKVTREEEALVKNLEAHKCFELAWKSLEELATIPLWQNSNDEVIRASAYMRLGRYDE